MILFFFGGRMRMTKSLRTLKRGYPPGRVERGALEFLDVSRSAGQAEERAVSARKLLHQTRH